MKIRRHNFLLLMVFLFFCFVPQQVRCEEIEIRVIASRAEVYLKPSTDSLKVSTVPMGSRMRVTEKRGDWYRVNLPPR